jgi:hypothetical protein
VNPEQLNQLLYEDESPTLDFKRDQYPFSKATDEEKSELLKDIVGFVNCWRRAEAFILIGVQEVQGGRSIVHGVTEHLPDHSLQQFVNSLTNRPILFGYEACEIEGKQVGIIRIPQQRRPVFLKRDYGKLKKGEVYVRRGSSTDPNKPADPDEIAMMGANAATTNQDASLMVEFAEIGHETPLGREISWSAEFCIMPDPKSIPTLTERSRRGELPGGRSFLFDDLSFLGVNDRVNRHYFHKLAEYVCVHRLFRQVRLVVSNTGEIPASNVRMEMIVPENQGIFVVDPTEIPEAPKRRVSALAIDTKLFRVNRAVHLAGEVEIVKNDHGTKIEIECGNLQPGRKVWTDHIWIGIGETSKRSLSGRLFATNLSQPQEFSVTINATVVKTTMTVEQLMAIDEPSGDDDR